MPSNRFDTSQEHQYVSSYVPLPFETIAALGEKANKNFADGKKAEADLGALGAAIKAAPMYRDDRKAFIDNYNLKLKTLVDEAKGDYGSKDFQAKANALTTEFKNDPKVQAFKGTLDAYEEYTKRKGKEGAERDLDYTYERDAAGNFVQKDVIKDGKYNSRFTKHADYDEAAKKVMGTIAKDANSWEGTYDLTNTQTGNNGETLVYNRHTGGYDGVSATKLQGLSKVVLPNYRNTDAGKHQLESILKNDFQLGDNAYNASYDQLSAAAYKGDENAKKMKEYVDNKMLSTIISGNAHQVGMKTEQGLDSHFDNNAKVAAANRKKEEFDGPMPTYQNPVQGVNEPATAKTGLSWLGINTDPINDDGTVNHRANIDSKYIVTKVDGTTSTYYTSKEAHEAAGNTGIITQQKTDKGEQQQNLTQFYTDLLNTARGLGLTIPKQANDKSKTDFTKLQSDLAAYGQNMQIQGNTSAGLQSRFGNNLSNELLGTVTSDSDGNTVFKKSPVLETAKIVDQTTGEVISKNKEEIAKDGAIRGINYFAPEEGTYKMDSKNKSYDYNPGDATLNVMTKNTHSLTQDILKARQGKQNSSSIIEPATRVIQNGKLVNVPAKTVNDYAIDITNNLKENFKEIPANNPIGLFLANHLNENLNKLKDYEPVSVNSSDIRILEGPRKGTPKYNYVAYQHKGFGTTNDADDKILRVDVESGQTEVMTLGDIHASERDYLQKNYAGAFEPSK